jgi:hypothetical protein
MATVNKDFKVKNGIQVAGSGVFGGPIVAADPTDDTHVVTRGYLNAQAGGVTVASTAPESPTAGKLWFDTVTKRINVYDETSGWLTVANVDDTLNVPQHIHDTSIGGTGLITTTFREGGSIPASPMSSGIDGGSPSSTEFTLVFDGGSVTDNFN